MLIVETAPINIYHKLRSQLSAFQVSLWVKMSNMHSRTPIGLLSPSIIKDNSDAGEITRMSKKRVQTGNFSDYVPLLIEGFSYSCKVTHNKT